MGSLFWIVFIILSLLTVLIDVFFLKHHFVWSIPGFYIFFGFIGCLLLSLLAKFIGKALLQRNEDYYEY